MAYRRRGERDWTIAYYEAYVSRGSRRALRQAMERTPRERCPDPRYWAGFGLRGLAE
jgi:hypothetical protein